jgi:hypothetical protein
LPRTTWPQHPFVERQQDAISSKCSGEGAENFPR